jgi:hypothetical protein
VSLVRATATRDVAAPPQRVYALLRDYRNGRPRILTENYEEYQVEDGGEGAGTVVSYRFKAGRSDRRYRLRVDEPQPGRILRERDEGTTFETTWDVTGTPAGSRVVVTSQWDGADGIMGILERTFAPLGMRRIYRGVLERLESEASRT